MRWLLCCLFFVAGAASSLRTDEAEDDLDPPSNIVLHPRATPSFVVDSSNGRFLMDGAPFRYISGSVHYFRIHPSQWQDRLKRVRALGFNAIQFYVPWNFHEVERRRYDFSGWRDFPHFVQLAAEQGLFTLLRLGPYACAEWENGGLPYWITVDRPDIKQRSSDSVFTSEVARWFSVLLPIVKPLLRQNGGPVLMVQIENEYGFNDACDHKYMAWLRDETYRLLGKDTVIYTTDPSDVLKCGAVNGTLSTVDFGPTTRANVLKNFERQKNYLPGGKGPLVNSEFYPGWFVQWGQHSQKLPSLISTLDTARAMFDAGASFNVFMIYGGTNYGFWNGADTNGAVITSYDYSAPITEGGNYTAAYFVLHNWIKALPGWQNPPLTPPEPPVAKAYGSVEMKLQSQEVEDLKKITCKPSPTPLSFEKIGQPFGYVLYYTDLKKCGTNLTIETLSDFGHVFLSKQRQGTMIKLFWKAHVNSVQLDPSLCVPGARLEILVENQGRQNFPTINDYKGILSPVLLDGEEVSGWTQCAVSMAYEVDEKKREKRRSHVKTQRKASNTLPFGLFQGVFNVDGEPADTYIQMRGWGKGHVVVNGHNVGRFWSSQGPQYTLYVPAGLLNSGENRISLLEIEGASSGVCSDEETCKLSLVDQPDIRFEEGIHFVDYRKSGVGPEWKTKRVSGRV